MDELETLRKAVELRYNVTLEKNDPMLAVMAVALQLVSECHDQNTRNHKAVVNELQKLQAAIRERGYPRLEGLGGVDNSSNIYPS